MINMSSNSNCSLTMNRSIKLIIRLGEDHLDFFLRRYPIQLSLLFIFLQAAHSQQYQPAFPPLPELTDEVKIKLTLQEFMFAARRGDQSTVERIVSTEKNKKSLLEKKTVLSTESNRIDLAKFTIQEKGITITGDDASVICDLTDEKNLSENNITLSLKKMDGKWKITEMPVLKTLTLGTSLRAQKTLSTSSVPTLFNGDRALIVIPHPLTPRFDDDSKNTDRKS